MKKISNYHELAVEKQRLQQRLALLKRDVDSEIKEIKEQIRPITRIVSLLGGGNGSNNNHSTTKKDSLLKMGASLGVDLLVGPRLAKAGMLTRLILPPILRSISSAVINRFKKKK